METGAPLKHSALGCVLSGSCSLGKLDFLLKATLNLSQAPLRFQNSGIPLPTPALHD